MAKDKGPEQEQGGVATLPEVYETGQPLREPSGDDETVRQTQKKAESWQERHTAWAGLKCDQRTQLAADRRWPTGPRQYDVSIPEDRIQPKVRIRANSPEEAQARYNLVCGIRQTDHEYQVVAI